MTPCYKAFVLCLNLLMVSAAQSTTASLCILSASHNGYDYDGSYVYHSVFNGPPSLRKPYGSVWFNNDTNTYLFQCAKGVLTDKGWRIECKWAIKPSIDCDSTKYQGEINCINTSCQLFISVSRSLFQISSKNQLPQYKIH